MSGPPPPPSPPDPQPYRIISYPNYFLATIAYGDVVTINPLTGPQLTAEVMDCTALGITLWHNNQMLHYRWERIDLIKWTPRT